MSNAPFRRYAIPLSTDLGKKLTEYFSTCDQVEEVAADFIAHIHERFQFPQLDLATVEYVSSDRGDAGGILGIIIPRASFTTDPEAPQGPGLPTYLSPDIWDIIDFPYDDDYAYACPAENETPIYAAIRSLPIVPRGTLGILLGATPADDQSLALETSWHHDHAHDRYIFYTTLTIRSKDAVIINP